MQERRRGFCLAMQKVEGFESLQPLYYWAAMSQENVQIVELAFDAIRRRDIEALLQLYDGDIEFLPLTGTLVESGGYAGHAGVRDYFEEVAQVWEEMRPYAHTTQPVDDHVVVTGGCAVRGIGSGVESDDRMAWVITLRNGKIVRHCGFGTAEEALEAVGVPARDGPATAGPAAS